QNRSQRSRDGGEEQRPIDPSRTRARIEQLTRDEDDEEPGEDAVPDDRVRVLEEVDDVVVAPEHDRARSGNRVEVAKALTVVEERDRERERTGHDVRDDHERPLEPVGDAARRKGERDVGDQRERELSEKEEHREREVVVAVPELPRQEREADRDHQRSEAVAWSTAPRHEAGEQE